MPYRTSDAALQFCKYDSLHVLREIFCLLNRSSRAQARATLGREFPIFALSMAKRVPSPTLVHGSCALSKIPYGGVSPVRLQAETSRDQPYPSRWPEGLKHQVCMPPFDTRFERTFVILMPSCFQGEYYQPPSLGLFERPPQPTGPLLKVGSGVPLIITPTTRSASLEDSHRFPRVTGYTLGLCPTT